MGKFVSFCKSTIVVLMLAVGSISTANSQTSRVIDPDHIFSKDQTAAIAKQIKHFEEYSEGGPQLGVIIKKTLKGIPIEEYATSEFKRLGVGKKDVNNGLLIVIALAEGQTRLEVGYGLESIIPDSVAVDVTKVANAFFAKKEFTNGILAMVKELETKIPQLETPNKTTNNFEINWWWVLIIFIVLLICFILSPELFINVLQLVILLPINVAGAVFGGGSSGGGGFTNDD